jgi:hypothetical protein
MFDFSFFRCIFLLLMTSSIWGQELDIRVYDQQIDEDEIIVYGDNEEYETASESTVWAGLALSAARRKA